MSPSEKQSEVIGVATERRGTGQITRGIKGGLRDPHTCRHPDHSLKERDWLLLDSR